MLLTRHGRTIAQAVVLTALLLALGTAAAAQTAAPPSSAGERGARPDSAMVAGEPFVRVTFLDVGQADAILIRAPEGQTALIDAGRSAPLGELAARDVDRIDLLVATHPHADHIGGMAAVLDALPVRFYMDNGQPHTTATYTRLLQTLRQSDVTYLVAEPRTLSLGSVQLEVLPLPSARGTDHNNRSVALVLRFGAFVLFLSGDSEVEELTHFLERDAVPDVAVLKAPHHGADNGFTWPFLEAARPEVVVISVGGNSYGHPRPEALAAYAATAERVYRTDNDGHVTVAGYADGRYEVATGRVLAAPAAAAASAAIALRVVADAPGNDHQNRNGEYVVLENRGPEGLDLGGWRLCDAARHCFSFPAGARLGAAGRVVIYTGSGRGDGTRFYMLSGSAVWNNDGDIATLYDATGAVVARHVYE